MARVVIADDHPIFRRGLCDVLEGARRFHCVGEAGDGPTALRLIIELTPDIAIVDIGMPRLDGLQVIAQAKRRPDAPQFVVLTLHDDPVLIERAFEEGASGYLLKEDAEAELLTCLDRVLTGRRYLSHSLVRDSGDGPHTPDEALRQLTAAERRVLDLVGDYRTSGEIGELLNISRRTVQNHRAHIVKKLGLRGPNALLRFAARHRAQS